MSTSSTYKTPDTNKENVKSRVRGLQQSRLGRVPLSPSKASPAPKVDDLAGDFDALSVSPSKPSTTSFPGTTSNKHPLAAPPATARSTTPSSSDETGLVPPGRGRRLNSLSSSSSSTAARKATATVDPSASTSSTTSSSTKGRSTSRKPIDDYRSPVQLLTRDPDWESLAPQAQHGMLGLHGDLPMNLTGVVKNDWQGRKTVVSATTMAQAREMSKNNSTVELPRPQSTEDSESGAVGGPSKQAVDDGSDDRYLGQRDEDGGFHAGHSLAAPRVEPTDDIVHEQRLKTALDIDAPSERILSYATAAPKPREDPTFAMQRELVQPLYARPGAVGGANGVYTNKSRKIPTQAERILDAPGMINDYYLNLIGWSLTNVVGVALRESVYIWNAETNETEHLSSCEQENGYVSSIDFSNDGSYAGVGIDNGDVEIWDLETKTRLRGMSGHQSQVSVLSWNNHIISSGCADGSIWHHDVRIGNHKVMELLGHSGEVCGLKWRQDGEALASGGNDNVVNCWDPRVGSVGGDTRGQAKWTKSTHTAAVKAIAWAPWNPNILASGGGTSDCRINIWSASTGSRLHTIVTPAQVTSIQFSPHTKEIFSTHGFPTNALMLHSYPSLEKVAEIRDAHDARILNSAVSPNGDLIVTNSGDENIKFWRIWEQPPKKKASRKENSARGVEKELRTIR